MSKKEGIMRKKVDLRYWACKAKLVTAYMNAYKIESFLFYLGLHLLILNQLMCVKKVKVSTMHLFN